MKKLFLYSFRVVAAETSEGVLTANEIRRFLLHQGPSSESPTLSSSPGKLSNAGDTMAGGEPTNPERLRELELEEMLTALDLDGDGKIKMDDFVRLLVVPQDVHGSPENAADPEAQSSHQHSMCAIL